MSGWRLPFLVAFRDGKNATWAIVIIRLDDGNCCFFADTGALGKSMQMASPNSRTVAKCDLWKKMSISWQNEPLGSLLMV